MNTAGQIGGTLSPIVFAWTSEHWGSVSALRIISALYQLGAECWWFVRPPVTEPRRRRLDDNCIQVGCSDNIRRCARLRRKVAVLPSRRGRPVPHRFNNALSPMFIMDCSL